LFVILRERSESKDLRLYVFARHSGAAPNEVVILAQPESLSLLLVCHSDPEQSEGEESPHFAFACSHLSS
jgi:hypothetical protein